MFTVSKGLETALNQQDLNSIRNAIINYINIDPDNQDGDAAEAIRYVESKGINVWERHDTAIPMNENQEQWTKVYAANVTADLHMNFSKERFAHWEKVASEVGRKFQKQKDNAPKQNYRAYSQSAEGTVNKGTASQPKKDNTQKEVVMKVALGVAVAAVVIGAIAFSLK